MIVIPGGHPFQICHSRKRRRGHCLLRFSHLLIVIVQLLALCAFAHAAPPTDVDWQGKKSTDWFDDKNWKSSDVPNADINAIIDDISDNIAVINTSGAAVGNLIVGDSSTGMLTIQGSGILAAGNITLGSATAGNGTITLTGPNASLIDSGTFIVGGNGTGILNVFNSSLANVNGILMSQASAGNATVTVDNARLINAAGLTIGDRSNAVFSVLDGASVTAGFVTTAQTLGSQGTLTLTNANLTVADTLVVASAGRSTLSLSGGATLNVNKLGPDSADAVVLGASASANATATITGLNTALLSAGDVVVGKAGTADVTVSAGGFLSTTTLTIARQAGSTGTLNIGAPVGSSPAAPGSLSAASVALGSGTATINLNHTSSALPFSPAITGNGTVNVLAGTTIFLGNSTYTGATNISAGATLQLGGGVGDTDSGAITSKVANSGVFISDRTGSFTLPGIISGTGTFQQLGTGTTILTGVNTYSGLTTISAGTLQIGNVTSRSSLGTGAVVDNSVLAVNRIDIYSLANPISGTGQFMQFGTGITALTADNTFTGNTTISAGTLQFGGNGTTGSVASNIIIDNSILAVLRTNSLTLSQVISGSGQFQQLGVGTTIFTVDNTYAGGTTISAGTLQLGNGSTSGSLVGAITDNGAFAVNRSNTLTLSGTISGTGVFNQLGSGTTILTANNTYSGRTNVANGTLQLGNGGATGGVVGTLIDGSVLVINHSNIFTLPGVISGSGLLRQLGTGTTILTADNTFTGTTIIAAGTLQLGNGGTTGSLGVGTLGMTIPFWPSTTRAHLSFQPLLSGTGQFNLIGSGTTVLTADNTYSGNTTIAAGALQLGNGGSTGSVAGNITDNSILVFNHSNVFTIGNFFSGSGQVQQISSNFAVIASDNTYTGLTTISAGGIELGAGSTSGSVVGDILNNGVLTANRTNTLTLPGTISGIGSFSQLGAGTTILTANNTYSGTTDISAGTLQLGDGHAAGSVAGNITNSSILVLDHANTLTLPGIISGSGQLQHLGTGTTILTSDNTYSGLTTISAGTLQLGSGGTTGSLGTGLVLDNSVLAVNHTNAITSGQYHFRQRAILAQLGSGVTVLTADNTYTGDTTIAAGTLQLGGNTTTGSVAGNIINNGVLAVDHSNSFTLSNFISGTGQFQQIGAGTTIVTVDNTFAGPTTISAGTLQLGNAGVTGSLGTSAVVDNSILAVNHSDTFTLLGAVSGSGQFNQNGPGTTIFAANNSYTGGTTIAAGTLQLGDGGTSGSVAGNILDNANLAFNRSDDLTFNNIISGTGTVTKLGINTLTIATDQTYTGATTISAGTLQLGSGGTAGALGTGAVIDNSILAVNRANAFSLTGIISGTGQFIQLGTGTTTLTADNTYTGVTTIAAGTLQLGNGGTTGSVSGNITDNGILALNHSNSSTFTLSNLVSGTGQLEQLGTGTAIITRDNTFTGPTTISAGTLQLGNAGVSGSLGTSAVVDNSVLAVNHSDTFTLLGAVTGTGQFNQNGLGTTIFAANNSYTGGTTISAGTLQLGDGHTTGSVAGNITDNSTLAIDRVNTLTLPGVISGTGQLQQLGTGTTILTANNTYIGATTISAGTLQLGSGGTAGSLGAGAVIDNSVFAVDRSNAIGLTGIISGSGQLIQLGTGTTTLTADNTYTGRTTISAGTLQLGNGNATGSVIGDITDNGVLALNHSNGLTLSNFVTGTGSLSQIGAGTTIVTADNTFTGPTTISAGTLQLGNAGVTGSLGTSAVINNSVLSVDHSDTFTLLGAVSGSGQFNQNGPGTTIFTANNTYTGGTTVSAGTLQLGEGGTSGSVAGNITDNANLTFDRSDNIAFSNVISGTGTLTKLGLNTVTIAADQTYTGATNVNQGILMVNAVMQTTDVLVNSGATLAGNGTIVGTVSIATDVELGGHISPGTPTAAGTLTTNSLILSSTAQLNFQLATADAVNAPGNDLIVVNGDLTLDGQLDITGTFGGPGTYRLIDYTGTLTDNVLTMGTLPGDLVSSSFLVQTSISGQVNLIVQAFGTGAQFWDGPNTTGNNVINGGSSTWSNLASNTNWTLADGSVNGQWNSGFAIFDVSNGTVTVDSTAGGCFRDRPAIRGERLHGGGEFGHPDRRNANHRSGRRHRKWRQFHCDHGFGDRRHRNPHQNGTGHAYSYCRQYLYRRHGNLRGHVANRQRRNDREHQWPDP